MKTIVERKVCRKCGIEKDIKEFRPRTSGFILNQCRSCEGEASKARRIKIVVPETITVTTKSGKVVEASVNPILGGYRATSPHTDKVLYFPSSIGRDMARVALSSFANVPRTGIQYQQI